MKEQVINCTVLTPMLGHGPKVGEKEMQAEIRGTEVRGTVRYFYRGLNDQRNTTDLYQDEAYLFGNTNQASKVRIAIVNQKGIKSGEYKPVMHKGFKVKGIAPGAQFDLRVATLLEDEHIKDYTELVFVGLLLGGIGQRSRRARGALDLSYGGQKMAQLDAKGFMKYLHRLISDNAYIHNPYSLNQFTLAYKGEKGSGKYPYIEKIELGSRKYSDMDTLLKTIDNSAHEVNLGGGSVYTGFAKGRVRMGSSVYVTAIKLKEGIYPLCTTVHPVFERAQDARQLDKREKFKQAFM